MRKKRCYLIATDDGEKTVEKDTVHINNKIRLADNEHKVGSTDMEYIEVEYDKNLPDHKELVADISKAYRELILDLYNHGCRDIKLDDCTWGVIVDDDFWNVFSEDGKYTRMA